MNVNKLVLFLYAVLLSFVLPSEYVFGQNVSISLPETNTLSLEEAVQLAVVNNAEIKKALLSVENADEQIMLAWSEVLPTVTSSAGYTRNIEIPVNFVPARFFDPNAPADELVPLQFGTDNTWQGGLTVSQNIFRGEAIVGISSSAMFKKAQQENLRASVQQIVTTTRKAYHAVLAAKEQLRLQQATLERLEENLKENRSRLKAGLLEEYDVLRLEVQAANQQPEIKDAEISVNETYRNLKQIIGLPLDTPIRVQGNLSEFELRESNRTPSSENYSIYKVSEATTLPDVNEEEALDIMQSLRGDLRTLYVQEDLKDREIRAIKSRFLPTITADYNLQWTSAQPGSPRPFENSVRFQTILVNVSFPLFTGFERKTNLDIAKIEKRSLQVDQWAAEQNAINEYETTMERLLNLRETVFAREKAVAQAKRGYEIANRRFVNGIGSQLEVTEAELQVREAELNYSLSIYNYLDIKADFDLALGVVPMIDETDYEF